MMNPPDDVRPDGRLSAPATDRLRAWSLALRRFRLGEIELDDLVGALQRVPLLVPVVAVDADRRELQIPVPDADGQFALPAFTGQRALDLWRAGTVSAPTDATGALLAAQAAGAATLLIDPGGSGAFAVPLSLLAALAAGRRWVPLAQNPHVAAGFRDSISQSPVVKEIRLASGDPEYRLAGPELVVCLDILTELDAVGLRALLAHLQQLWEADSRISLRVDALSVRVQPIRPC